MAEDDGRDRLFLADQRVEFLAIGGELAVGTERRGMDVTGVGRMYNQPGLRMFLLGNARGLCGGMRQVCRGVGESFAWR